jgi:ABC-type transporter Mla subunit MlaD
MAGGVSVQTTLTVNDQLSPVLEQLVKTIAGVSKALKDLGEIKAFEGLVKETREAVKTLGGMSVMPDKLTTTLGVLGGGSSRALERLAKAVGTVPGAFDQAAGGADKLGKAYAEAIGKASGLSGVVSQLQDVTKAATDALSVQKELNKSLGRVDGIPGMRI